MYVRIGFDLRYSVPAPTTLLLMLHVHPDRAPLLHRPDKLLIEPGLREETFTDAFGNLASRVVLPPGRVRFYYDNIIEDSGEPEPRIDGARLHPVEELPDECFQFLLASRYCEVDKLSQMAWDLFGKTPATWERVQAVMDWVHARVEFGYQYANSTKTAADVCDQRQGVCRDFQHLAIPLLRAMNIPARYATGYLGDIGVPANPSPMDFSAWLEVYLGGRWYTLDARHNTPRNARVLMARGRDATDVALSTSFGPCTLEYFMVWTDEVPPQAMVPETAAAGDLQIPPGMMMPMGEMPVGARITT
jgi:transglutaminase-like putative cysteine protease